MPVNRIQVQRAAVAFLAAISALFGGCAEQVASPPPVQAAQVKQATTEKALTPEEAMATRNKMMKRQTDYWRAHGQGK